MPRTFKQSLYWIVPILVFLGTAGIVDDGTWLGAFGAWFWTGVIGGATTLATTAAQWLWYEIVPVVRAVTEVLFALTVGFLIWSMARRSYKPRTKPAAAAAVMAGVVAWTVAGHMSAFMILAAAILPLNMFLTLNHTRTTSWAAWATRRVKQARSLSWRTIGNIVLTPGAFLVFATLLTFAGTLSYDVYEDVQVYSETRETKKRVEVLSPLDHDPRFCIEDGTIVPGMRC